MISVVFEKEQLSLARDYLDVEWDMTNDWVIRFIGNGTATPKRKMNDLRQGRIGALVRRVVTKWCDQLRWCSVEIFDLAGTHRQNLRNTKPYLPHVACSILIQPVQNFHVVNLE